MTVLRDASDGVCVCDREYENAGCRRGRRLGVLADGFSRLGELWYANREGKQRAHDFTSQAVLMRSLCKASRGQGTWQCASEGESIDTRDNQLRGGGCDRLDHAVDAA